MTTETQELKACWHCNGNAAMVRAIRDGRQVFCRCGASSPPEFFGRSDKPSADQRAITAWNTRPREEALEAEVAALGAQVRSASEAAQVVWSGEHARLEAEVGRLREGVRRALTYMDPMSPGHSSHKMADARRVLQTAISHPKGADE